MSRFALWRRGGGRLGGSLGGKQELAIVAVAHCGGYADGGRIYNSSRIEIYREKTV